MNRTYTLDEGVHLFHADCRDALRALPDNSIDSCVTDPPYALVSIVKRFGSPNAAPAKGNDAYMRASAGFMGKQWDTGECAMDPGFWADVLRVLKPGAHLVAFGASRGYHRMACAIEDAGFEIRDSLLDIISAEPAALAFLDSLNDAQRDAFVRMLDHAAPGGPLAWIYGTGFPKSHDVSKGIDKAAGVEREVIGKDKNFGKSRIADGKTSYGDYAGSWDITAPATPEAAEWEGWGTALKPAFEPIVLARKPLSEGTVAANVLRWRTGALNIDACRIGTERRMNKPVGDLSSIGSSRTKPRGEGIEVEGRWPANVCHDGSDEVVAGFPNSNGSGSARTLKRGERIASEWGMQDMPGQLRDAGTGSAARFFYSAKASRADRAGSKHPTVKPVSLMEWLCALVTPPGGTVLDPFAGSGTTGVAARAKGFNAVLCERESEYVADILRRFDHIESPSIVPADDTHTHRTQDRADRPQEVG